VSPQVYEQGIAAHLGLHGVARACSLVLLISLTTWLSTQLSPIVYRSCQTVGTVSELEVPLDQSGIFLSALAGSANQPFMNTAKGHGHLPGHHAARPEDTVRGNGGVH
jgi:hypothetical protein